MEQDKKTILLIDDNEDARRILEDFLGEEGEGYNIISASSKAEGLKKYNDHKDIIDAIITDNDMPEANAGLELIEEIRKQGATLPIILVSGKGVDKQPNPVTGHTAFFMKPYNLRAIAELLKQKLAAGREL